MPFERDRPARGLIRRLFGRSRRPAPGRLMSATAFHAAFSRERALAMRTSRSFTLIVFIPASDLPPSTERAAEILGEGLRESDLAGLLDDQRIAVLLPETSEAGVAVVLEKLLSTFAEEHLSYNYKLFRYPDVDGRSARSAGAAAGDGTDGGPRPGPGTGLPDRPAQGPNGHRADSVAMIGAVQEVASAASSGLVAHRVRRAESGTAVAILRRPEAHARAARLIEPSKAGALVGGPGARSVAGDAMPTLAELRLDLGAAPAHGLQELLLVPLSWRRRLLDIVVSAGLLVVLSPLLLTTALLVKLTSRGPIIFKQLRAGQGGRGFWFYKFRSMYSDAEERRVDLKAHNEKDGPIFKMRRDPRITPLGRFIRRASIDELPQLFNVLKGDMTLIGPRPPRMDEVELYEPWQRQRLELKGGLTCIWQVSGRSEISFNDWVRMDLEYARVRSLWFDISLLLRTVTAVLTGRGAY